MDWQAGSPQFDRDVYDGGEQTQSQAADNSAITEVLRTRMQRVDLALLLTIPLLLVVVFSLADAIKLELTFAYQQPTVVTAFTAHFIHLDVAHLAANLLLYGVIASAVYALSLLSDRRTEFLAVVVTFLVVFPVVLSGLNLVIPRPRIGYGFSGIIMAFAGLLTVMIGEYVAVQFGGGIHRNHSAVLFYLVVAIITAVEVPFYPGSRAVLGLSVVGGLLTLSSIMSSVRRAGALNWEVVCRPGYAEITVWGLALVVMTPFIAVPSSTPIRPGTVPNVYLHFLGFAFGYLVPFIGLNIIETGSDVIPRISPPHAG